MNDSTFQLKLSTALYPDLRDCLSMQYCSVVPKEVVEKYGQISEVIPWEPVHSALVPGKKARHWCYKRMNITLKKTAAAMHCLTWRQSKLVSMTARPLSSCCSGRISLILSMILMHPFEMKC